ncbi:MAG TPA: hypothetical protein VFB84_21845 [Micromonosporaceae bacterium]|nr:hypothetical protein [Micromonosporaceae bacterium]
MIINLAEEERKSILQRWGNAHVVEAVQQALTGAGFTCRSIAANAPSDMSSIRGSEGLAFPNARYFPQPHQYLSDILDDWGIPYIGSGRSGHENCNKFVMKTRLRAAGIPTPKFQLLGHPAEAELIAHIDGPYVLKPCTAAASLGVVRAASVQSASEAAAQLGVRFGWPVLVEAWERYREFTVATLGDGGQWHAFPVEIVVPSSAGYLTEEVKRLQLAGAAETIEPVVDIGLCHDLTALARHTAEVLDIRDYARMEILLNAAGQLLVIDVNTLPGLRQHSYLPMCLSVNVGFDFTEAVLSVVAAAHLRLNISLGPPLADIWGRLAAYSG